MHEQRVARVYYREMAASLAVYTALLLASARFGRPMADGVARTFILASPMIGFGLMIWSIARQLSRIDEYRRQRLLNALAIVAAVTAGLSFTYGFLETAGYPHLSMFTVSIVMGATMAIVCLVRALRER
jgi:hypothetical protein